MCLGERGEEGEREGRGSIDISIVLNKTNWNMGLNEIKWHISMSRTANVLIDGPLSLRQHLVSVFKWERSSQKVCSYSNVWLKPTLEPWHGQRTWTQVNYNTSSRSWHWKRKRRQLDWIAGGLCQETSTKLMSLMDGLWVEFGGSPLRRLRFSGQLYTVRFSAVPDETLLEKHSEIFGLIFGLQWSTKMGLETAVVTVLWPDSLQ